MNALSEGLTVYFQSTSA